MGGERELFTSIGAMEPLLPQSGRAALARLSVEIFKKSGELKASLPSPIVRSQIADLVREMNSYYSNLIEGHKTLPRDIEKALRKEFAEDEEERRNQLLSVAHIEAEREIVAWLESESETSVYSEELICRIHREIFSHLPAEEWFTTSLEGKRYPLVPGVVRDYNVEVGSHTPPMHSWVADYLKRFDAFYASDDILETDRLIAVAAAHHRLAWIHPFGDGNGRVVRLHSQVAMMRAGLYDEGLWTLSRGLARTKSLYYRRLQGADRSREGDLDGRGNLSDRHLSEFCRYFLEQVLDQLEFMIGLIAPLELSKRIESYFRFTRVDLEERRREQFRKLVSELLLKGEMKRGAVQELLGLKSTVSRTIIKEALEEGLIESSSEKGPLRISFPEKVREYYFPSLFVDLPSD